MYKFLLYFCLSLVAVNNHIGMLFVSGLLSRNALNHAHTRRSIIYPFLQQNRINHGVKLFSNTIGKNNDEYTLVIVESPGKASTISKYLNKNEEGKIYKVEASLGHVRDLPQNAKQTNLLPSKYRDSKWSNIGIDLDSPTFDPMYIVMPDKVQQVKLLMNLGEGAKEIILATDEDREGEAIAFHLKEILKDNCDSFKRVTFTEITEDHIRRKMQSPREIDLNLVNAQECRRLFDRLAGYQMSPALWKKIAPGLSAGRVQTCALSLIVNREIERLKFIRTTYSSIIAKFSFGDATLASVNGTRIASSSDFDERGKCLNSTFHLTESISAKYISDLSKAQNFTVTNIASSLRRTKAPKPFITSTVCVVYNFFRFTFVDFVLI